MSRLIDMAGQRFGKLKVLERAPPQGKGRAAHWICRCDCGQLTKVSGIAIRNRGQRSCGCDRTRLIDLTGQRFGRLVVLERGPNHPTNDEVTWICRCDCGNVAKVKRGLLRKGLTQSCGCLQRERIAARLRRDGEVRRAQRIKEMTGQRFGRLTVTGFSHVLKELYYHCQCDCGNRTVVGTYALRHGLSRSCGCLRRDQFIKRGLAGRKRAPTSALIGRTFNYLTVLRALPRNHSQRLECRCVCGNLTITSGSALKSGSKKSCGCMAWTRHQRPPSALARSWRKLVTHKPTPLYERSEAA